MYPLKVVLVGCSESVAPEVRHQLVNHGAAVEAEYPDVQTAAVSLPNPEEKKRLFIYQMTGSDDPRALERLNDVFVGRPVLALVESTADAAPVLQAMRAGAAQVVPLPPTSEDFQQALHRIARQFGYPGSNSKVIAVSGVSEGCGATSLAINVAAEIAARHHRATILMELSLRLGRLATYLDVEPRFTTHDLLLDPAGMDLDVVRQALTPVADHLHILAGPFQGIPSATTAPQHVLRLIEHARRLAHVIVLDMPYTYDDLYFKTMAQADQVVLVAEQSVPSIHALKVLRETIQKTEGWRPLHLVVNRYDPHRREFRTAHLQELLPDARIFAVTTDETAFAAAVNEGRVLRQVAPNSQALAEIDVLVAALLGRPAPPRPAWRMPTLWRRLVAAIGKA